MRQSTEIIGTFCGESRVFEDADKTRRTIIGHIEDADGNRTTIRGEAAEGELVIGLTYRFYGYQKDHPKYGPQFSFNSFVVETPAGREAVTAYLKQCDGIGAVKAEKMWSLWRDDAIRTLRENPGLVAEKVKLTAEQALAAAELLSRKLAVEKTTVELYGILNGRGLPRFKKLVEELISDYGSLAGLTVKRNPYLLMRYPGCGFLRTDKLWLDFGKNPSRLKRQALCAWHAIASSGEGHTWFPWTDARDALTRNIAGAEVRIEDAIELALRARIIVERREGSRRWIAERGKAWAEGKVAELLLDAAGEGSRWPRIGPLERELSPHQMEQLSAALRGKIAVLAGSPGTGKTHCTAALIRLLIGHVGLDQIAACAPTGKAAVRMTEALERNGVELKATTIHSLLVVRSGDDGGGWGFDRNESNPLPPQFVFVDESSMIDTGLMASLLRARARGTHILFVGDPNQLAPVGHGAPLRDFIAAKVPTGTLTEIRRNSGLIVRSCAEIRDRQRFTAVEKPNLDTGDNLVLIERGSPEAQIETLTAVMGQIMSSGKHHPIWDVQVIVAVNKKSPLARKTLNAKLQDLLNPEGEQAPGSPFRVGDKIINTKNGWLPTADKTTPDGKVYVANGEQAEVFEVYPNRTIARLTAPERLVVIPRGTTQGDEAEGGEEEGTGTGCNWDLGYAISCHKSQGSEWPVVILLPDEYGGARMVQSKQWLYTGLSRAKQLCLVIGKRTIANEMCHRDGLFRRKTFLVERMAELAAAREQEARREALRESLFKDDSVLEGVC